MSGHPIRLPNTTTTPHLSRPASVATPKRTGTTGFSEAQVPVRTHGTARTEDPLPTVMYHLSGSPSSPNSSVIVLSPMHDEDRVPEGPRPPQGAYRNIRVIGGSPVIREENGQLVLSGRRVRPPPPSSSLDVEGQLSVDVRYDATQQQQQQLAVIPFTPPHRLQSPLGGDASSTNVSGSGDAGGQRGLIAAVDSSQWALSTTRVCPTCLRPYETEGDGDGDGSDSLSDSAMGETELRMGAMRSSASERHHGRWQRGSRSGRGSGGSHLAHREQARMRRMLSPQYFRALAASQPLAISDGLNDRAAVTSSNRKTRVITSALLRPPPLDYVSPTGRSPVSYQQALDASVNPAQDVGVEWLDADGDDARGPSSVMRSFAFGPVSSGEEEEKLLPQERAERARLVHEEEAAAVVEGGSGVGGGETAGSSPIMGGMNGYYKRFFVEVQKLGSGTYGGVYLCQHVMEGVPLGSFALKKIPVGDNVEYLQKVLREVRILEEVKRHPNVVEYNHSWVESAQLADFGPPVRCLFILMEYASEGSLDTYVERYGTALSTVAVWYFFLSAVAGTAHLHQKQILHRDLKPQNLLLTGVLGKPPRVLVSDFGTAALLGENGYERTGGTGTLEYMAPELMEVLPNFKEDRYVNHHTKASDVWSLGMILYYLACNATLPPHHPDGSVVLNIASRSPYPRPPEMVELIRAMLQRDPKRRPSCSEILSSTVVQTLLRSFNSASTAGAADMDAMARDVMPRDRSTTPSPSTQRPRRGRLDVLQPTPSLSSVLTAAEEEGDSNGDRSRSSHDGGGGNPTPNEEPYSDKDADEGEGQQRPHSPANWHRGASPDGGSGEGGMLDPLQSSRVELMSTTVPGGGGGGGSGSTQNLMEIPLLMQYRSQDGTSFRAGDNTSGRLPSASRQSNPQASGVTPRKKRGRARIQIGPSGTSPGTISPEPTSSATRRPPMVDAEVQTDPVKFVD